jgi:isopentenyl-diphosphate delta-isomerase type 1
MGGRSALAPVPTRNAQHRCRCAMEEQFEVFDEAGRPLGVAARSTVHREGLWHRAANVFVFRSDGRLLIQRRQTNKDLWPGAWDVSVGEHLQPGESFEQGALRGLHEELGIDGVVLEPLGTMRRSRLEVPEAGMKDYEFQRSFRVQFDGEIVPDPGEVMQTQLVALEELARAFRARPDSFTPWFRRRAVELNLVGSV